jgi:hypothetical protein
MPSSCQHAAKRAPEAALVCASSGRAQQICRRLPQTPHYGVAQEGVRLTKWTPSAASSEKLSVGLGTRSSWNAG